MALLNFSILMVIVLAVRDFDKSIIAIAGFIAMWLIWKSSKWRKLKKQKL